MDNCKYVLIDKLTECGRLETFYMFPPFIKHSEFCKEMVTENDSIISAGFVDLESKNCYGKSTSLKVKSNPEIDNIYLKTLF